MEEKIKFYSQYLFQEVLMLPYLIWSGNPPEPSHEEWGEEVLTLDNIKIVCENNFPLCLKSLAAISDEDALEVIKIYKSYDKDIEYKFEIHNNKLGEAFKQIYYIEKPTHTNQKTEREVVANFKKDGISILNLNFRDSIVLQAYQYLISKGYAVNYNGISPEKQIERGWIVLNIEDK